MALSHNITNIFISRVWSVSL